MWLSAGRAAVDWRQARHRVPAYLRLWLITLSQFEDVVSQENGLGTGAVTIDYDELRDLGHLTLTGDGFTRYPTVLCSATVTDAPAVTLSCAVEALDEPTSPALAYIQAVACGLLEAHDLDDGEIATYIRHTPGVIGSISAAQISQAVAEARRIVASPKPTGLAALAKSLPMPTENDG